MSQQRRSPVIVVVAVVAAVVVGLGALAIRTIAVSDPPTPFAVRPTDSGGGAVEYDQWVTAAMTRLGNTSAEPVKLLDVEAMDSMNVDIDGYYRAPPSLLVGNFHRWPRNIPIEGTGSAFDPSDLRPIVGAEIPAHSRATALAASPTTLQGLDTVGETVVAVKFRLRPGKEEGWVRGVRVTYQWPDELHRTRTMELRDWEMGVCTPTVFQDDPRKCGPT